jgi:hypothetical protein
MARRHSAPSGAVLVAAFAAALCLFAVGVHAIGPGAYPPGDCRTGTDACPNGCCTKACPNGSAGAAVPNGVPGLSAQIVGLTFDAKTALVRGTLVVTNAGRAAIPDVITEVSFAPFEPGSYTTYGIGNMWCGGDKGKALAAGASRACPFALIGGASQADLMYQGNQASSSRKPLPGVDPVAFSNALAFSTSDVPQVSELKRGAKASSVRAAASVRRSEGYPQPGQKEFICDFGYVPAKSA